LDLCIHAGNGNIGGRDTASFGGSRGNAFDIDFFVFNRYAISDMLCLLRKMMPAWAFDVYHLFLSWLSATWYGDPSHELIVIGVTGTNGKSSTAYFLSKALEATGAKTGMTSTALFKIGDLEWTNASKMTMLGRFQLQRLLRKMVNAGCTYAVVETSSQGIVQYRHRHIAYDGCIFTNLTPEHIEAHGGFEHYKQAKMKLFEHTTHLPPKVIHGVVIPRVAILNKDDAHANDFARVWKNGTIVWYGLHEGADCVAKQIQLSADRIAFDVDGVRIEMQTPGDVMVYNALASIATAKAFGIPLQGIADRLVHIKGMPGRYESIDEGQDFKVIVDYAYEPVALGKLFDFVQTIKGTGRIIHLTGSAGGGRDIARRAIIGKLSAERADVTIVTNEDPYDDDPELIIKQVADSAVQYGKKEGETLFRISDRRVAIEKAIALARSGDIVLLTGKGNEPVMATANGRKLPFDDREEARKALRKGIGDGV
jgi:UDP-N-acetylmuramoyl-L-alanyl-D-glutamate--2,6-diaminopimelate ligase